MYSQECITKSMQLPLEMRLGIGAFASHSNVYSGLQNSCHTHSSSIGGDYQVFCGFVV